MKKPFECCSIQEIRNEIDRIDEEIINRFWERHMYVEEITKFKTDTKSAIAINRKEQVIYQRGERAAELGLNAELFREIYTILLDYNIQHEIEILESKKQIV